MKRMIALLLVTLLLLGMNSSLVFAEGESASAESSASSAEDSALPAALTPEEMLARMTSEEKIAQMLMPAFQNYTDEKGAQQKLTEMRPEIAETL